jgi:malate dehydrogenase
MPKNPITVCLTGAAGQIAYSLLFSIGRGDVFGRDQPIILHLLDIEMMMGVLEGVVMELHDCSFPLLKQIVATTKAEEAFNNCDAAILVGAVPRREGMERKDLLQKNAMIFKTQGEVLDRVAKKSVKVLVVGNPSNTNALITSHFAPSIPKSQFTCLTHLDLNRARGFVARRLGVNPKQVHNVIIWGNHSATQYPDVKHAVVEKEDGTRVPVTELVNDDAWLHGEFVSSVQKRGAAVIQARKLSSALSAAKAIADHMHTWWFGTAEGEFTSMGIVSDGAYNTTPGIVYSFPVTIKDGVISVVKNLDIDDFSRQMMEKTNAELTEEKESAMSILH